MTMNLEHLAKILIYIHAFFGGIGLLFGIISVFVVKGSQNHKKAGIIFSYAMIINSLISLVVARIPNHQNSFLFTIGLFTIYLVLSGNRALTLKSKFKSEADWKDKLVSGAMFLTAIVMIVTGILGIINNIDKSSLYVFFGIFGLFLSVSDFRTFKIFTSQKNAWLISHIGRMVGALIASITAFLVAGAHIKTILAWILPTILGTIYIIYWIIKVNKKQNLKL